jgi:hypothetical protein
MKMLPVPAGSLSRVLPLVVAGAVASMPAPASAQVFPNDNPSYNEVFQAAQQGFGLPGFPDRNNSQAWSMAWWNGKLYVGTGRATYCVQQATLALFRPDLKPYPPKDKDVQCTPDPRDLPLRAEIWRWTPDPVNPSGPGTWDRVHQADNDVQIVGTNKFISRDIGYRGMTVFTEADGTQALYVAGDSTRAAQGSGFAGPVPPPQILRSTDGVTFTALPFNPDAVPGAPLVSGFRNLLAYKNRLYVVGSVGQLGHGVIFEATHPELGNDFRMISPLGADLKPLTFFEIEAYNGFLFAGTGVQPSNDDTPFSLLKTDATGDLPYHWTTVIPEGGYRTKKPSAAVISMRPFKAAGLGTVARLYVGTDREVFRVNPDDTWDLVVGTPRKTPDGHLLQPLSGFDIGFDNIFDIHMWRMGDYSGWLYIGTQDQSAKWRNLKGGFGAMLAPRMGFDQYATADGWRYSMITRTGFGDLFNNGMRNFASTPFGFFMGTANHYYGTRIYRGVNVTNPVATPKRLEVESAFNVVGLSWEGCPSAVHYHVYRDSGFSNPQEVGSPLGTDGSTLAGCGLMDKVKPFGAYHYYVVAQDNLTGRFSEPSNMVRVPFKGPVPTFQSLEALLASWSAPAAVTGPLGAAKAAVQADDYATAMTALKSIVPLLLGNPQPLQPAYRNEDFGVLLTKFIRRVGLAQAGALPKRMLMK